MKTSKEMQIKILALMSENVKNNKPMFDRIEFRGDEWLSEQDEYESYEYHNSRGKVLYFSDFEYRIKPETITLKNGVEIPKPLTREEVKEFHEGSWRKENNGILFLPSLSEGYETRNSAYCLNMNIKIAYITAAEAKEASKALFGIE